MTAAIRHDDLRRQNRAMVISAVRRANGVSRTEIAGSTALSHSTISAISSDLIAEGILCETKSTDGTPQKRGRPQVALRLNPDAAAVVAMSLSLNSLAAAVVDYAGQLVAAEHTRLPTLTMAADELTGRAVTLLQKLVDGRPAGASPIRRIVLAVQGITDSAGRTMLWSPITPHTDLPFADALEEAFNIPVTVQNDCTMMAIALPWREPDRYRSDFIAMLLSHGIGMGLVLKGAVFTGTRSSGGEFGHMIHVPGGALCRCGRRGCVEAYVGNYAIWRNARQASENEPPVSDISDADMKALAGAARSGDVKARAAFEKAGEALGYALGSLFALIDPVPVAFIGAEAAAFDLIEPALRASISKTAGGQHADAIAFATIPEEAPLIREGCAVQALTFIDQEIFAPGSAAAFQPVSWPDAERQSSRMA